MFNRGNIFPAAGRSWESKHWALLLSIGAKLSKTSLLDTLAVLRSISSSLFCTINPTRIDSLQSDWHIAVPMASFCSDRMLATETTTQTVIAVLTFFVAVNLSRTSRRPSLSNSSASSDLLNIEDYVIPLFLSCVTSNTCWSQQVTKKTTCCIDIAVAVMVMEVRK